MTTYQGGLPGSQIVRAHEYRSPLINTTSARYIAGGCFIDGSESRDPLNTGYVHVLRPGLIMGMITATGLWAPSIIGLVTADYTSGGTSLTVSAATATEIVRRVGSSGTLDLTHAPTATGTVVAQATLTYSAVNTTTGVLTITDIGANVETGAIIGHPSDGSSTPLAILGGIDGIRVTDEDGNSVDKECATMLIGGDLNVDKIINYPDAANTTLIAWLKGKLNSASNSLFTFSDAYRI